MPATVDFASFRLTAKCLLTPFHDVQANSCSIRAGKRGNAPRRKYLWGVPEGVPLGDVPASSFCSRFSLSQTLETGASANLCGGIAANHLAARRIEAISHIV